MFVATSKSFGDSIQRKFKANFVSFDDSIKLVKGQDNWKVLEFSFVAKTICLLKRQIPEAEYRAFESLWDQLGVAQVQDIANENDDSDSEEKMLEVINDENISSNLASNQQVVSELVTTIDSAMAVDVLSQSNGVSLQSNSNHFFNFTGCESNVFLADDGKGNVP